MAKSLMASKLLEMFYLLSKNDQEQILIETHGLAEEIIEKQSRKHYDSEEIDKIYFKVLKDVEEGSSIQDAIKKFGFERKTLYRRISSNRKQILKAAKKAYTKYYKSQSHQETKVTMHQATNVNIKQDKVVIMAKR